MSLKRIEGAVQVLIERPVELNNRVVVDAGVVGWIHRLIVESLVVFQSREITVQFGVVCDRLIDSLIDCRACNKV